MDEDGEGLSSEPDWISASSARTAGLAGRDGLNGDQRVKKGAELLNHLEGIKSLRAPGRLAIYRSIDSEVDLRPAETSWRQAGWNLFLPRITALGVMEFVAFEQDSSLTTNRYGIDEPDGEAIVPLRLDAVLCPCVAVDSRGTRIGFGAGYYDRALANLPGVAGVDRPLLVGLAWDAQVLNPIQVEDWDIPMDLVVTESGILKE